ncbi:MAG: glycosyltransferase family 4 protein [Nitrospira sp.]|nr:glycosyltransferase family 4 protein [Nitrospira sp.]
MIESCSLCLYGAPVASFAVTWLAITVLLRSFSDRILDHPNERSLHEQPVPRTGGMGVAAGIAAGALLVSPVSWWPLWIGAAFLVGVSFLDDLVGLPIVGRLIAHFIAAGLCVTGLVSDQMGLLWVAVAIVATVWMINLYNFMDGMDGLAGGMALFGFGFLAVAAWLAGDRSLALVSLSIAAAAGAFLLFNFHPARMFLGDAGSTTFGYLAAGLGLTGWQHGVWSLWVPLLVFSPFIIDASVTLARRLMRGEKFWQAHRSHYYQRVVLSGWSHGKTALAEYGVMVCCGCGALAFQLASDHVRFAIVGIWILAFLGLAQSVSGVPRRGDPEPGGRIDERRLHYFYRRGLRSVPPFREGS